MRVVTRTESRIPAPPAGKRTRTRIPASSEPAMPTSMVCSSVIGSRPGSARRASAPTNRPERARMSREPITLAQLVHRAVELCDPDGGDGDLSALLERFEDADVPVTAVVDIDARMAEATAAIEPDGTAPSLAMAAAVVVYLAHRRDELDAPR